MATGTLVGTTIASTHESILKLGTNTAGSGTATNTNLHATTLKVIEDGAGNNACIQLAQNRVEIVPVANHANAFEVSQTDGTQIFNIASDTPALIINAATVTLTQDTNFVLTGGLNGMSIDGTTFSVDGATNRVGIGTAAPQDLLHVASGYAAPAGGLDGGTIILATSTASNYSNINVIGATTHGSAIYLGDPTDADYGTILQYGAGSGEGGRMSFTAGSVVTMSLRGGNVGIGTAAPAQLLHVEKASGAQVLVKSTNLDDNVATGFTTTAKAVTSAGGTSTDAYNEANLYMYLHSSLNDPVAVLQLDSSDGVVHYIYADNDDDLRSSSSGAHIGTTTGELIHDDMVVSDERLKNISSDVFPYGLDEINKLTPIQYSWKNKEDKSNKFGFGAQTLVHIIPEAVGESKDICIDGYLRAEEVDGKRVSKPKSDRMGKKKIDYQALTSILVKAIQELSAKVDALENNNNEQGESSNEQGQEEPDSGASAGESAGQDSGGDEGDNSDSPDAASGASEASDSSSDDGNESAGSSGSDASDDSEGGSGADDSAGSEGESSGDRGSDSVASEEEPSDDWTKDQLKGYMDAKGIEYNSGDTKQDLLDKIILAGEGPSDG